jgi:thioester reductase-like protein
MGIIGADYHDLLIADSRRFDLYGYVNTTYAALAGRLAYVLDTRGEAVSVDTACSSSLVAIHLGVNALRRGDAEIALVGGANLVMLPEFSQAFARAGMLAVDGRCKAFDARGDGFVRSDGVVCVALMPLSRAVAGGHPVYAIVKGTCINHDGGTGQYKTPNVAGQVAMLRELYARLGLDPRDTHYAEAHGTGTRAGDPVEVEAIARVLCERRDAARPLLIGSVKTAIGHCEAAAGLAGVVKTVMALSQGVIPRNLHFREPNPAISWAETPMRVVAENTPWPLREGERARAGVSAFGLTGVNAHVLLEQWQPPAQRDAAGLGPLLWAHADGTREGLRANVRAQLDGWTKFPTRPSRSIALAAAARPHLEHRVAFTGSDGAELRAQAAAWLEAQSDAAPNATAIDGCKVAFVFPGQGAQWVGMAREMLDVEGAFADALRTVDAVIHREAGFSVCDVLRAGASDALDDISVLQPTLFAVQIALAAMWQSLGVRPAAVVGHSMGETAAACVAGALSLEDGAAVICRRSRLMKSLRGRGAMLLVERSLEEAAALVRGREHLIAVAVHNSPASVVLSGDADTLRAVASELELREVFCRPVKVDVASHSPQMDAIEEALVNALGDLRPRTASVPMFSTVRAHFGRRPEDGAELDARYWWENLRLPVRFAAAIEAAIDHGIELFVELSAHPLLCQAVAHSARRTPRTLAVPSMRRAEPVLSVAIQSLGTLYARGVMPTWSTVLGEAPRVRLPPRVWSDETHPVDFTRRTRSARESSGHPWLAEGWTPPERPEEVVFRTGVSLNTSPWLIDHRVQGEVVFPAAGYVELATAAVASLFTSRAGYVELRDLHFERALFLDETATTTLDLVVRHEGATGGSFEFHGRSARESSTQRIAQGSFAWCDIPQETRSIAPVVLADDATTTQSLYHDLRRVGMEYGPTFQGLTRIDRTEHGRVTAIVAAPVGIADELAAFRFHPALLDAAFQACLAGIGDLSVTHLPVAIDLVRVLACATRESRVSVCVTDEATGFVADLRVRDARGMPLVDVKGLRAKAIAATAIDPFATIAYETAWVSAELTEPRAVGAGTWLIFNDTAGVGATVCERLTRAGHRTIEVERTHRAGDAFRFDPTTRRVRMRPEDASHWSALITQVEMAAPDGLRGVAYLWPIDVVAHDSASADSVESATLAVVWPMIEALQQVGARSVAFGRLWVVTEGAFGGDNLARTAVMSSLWGAARVAANEMPETRCARIDLDDRLDATLHALATELLCDGPERELRLGREGRRAARMRRAIPECSGTATVSDEACPFTAEWSPTLSLVEHIVRPPERGEVEVDIDLALVRAPGKVKTCAGTIVRANTARRGLVTGARVLLVGVDTVQSRALVRDDDVVVLPDLSNDRVAATLAWATAHAQAEYVVTRIAATRATDAVLVLSENDTTSRAVIEAANAAASRVVVVSRDGAGASIGRNDARWVSRAREALGGGADVVVSLGVAPPRELDGLLRPLGRVVQLGAKGSATHLASNVTFTRVNLHDLWSTHRGELRTALWRAVVGVATETLYSETPAIESLPTTLDAASHVMRVAREGRTVTAAPGVVRTDGVYLVTGGAGGVGLVVARSIADAGAREVVLIGRRPRAAVEDEIARVFSGSTTSVRYEVCDVACEEEIARVFASIDASGRRLRGVVHAAGLLDDGVVSAQTIERFRTVFAPKVRAAWNLHRALEDRAAVDFFVVFSSIAGVIGSPGQSNYAAANAFMDGLSRARRRCQMVAQSQQWGPWAEVGLATQRDRAERLAQRGLAALRPGDGVRAFHAALAARNAEVVLSRFDAQAWSRSLSLEHDDPTLAALARRSTAPPPNDPLAEQARRLLATLARGGDDTGMCDFLLSLVARVLGRSPDQLSPSRSLSALGADSLMVVEIRAALETYLGLQVSVTALLRGVSLQNVAQSLCEQLGRRRLSRAPSVSPLVGDATLGSELRVVERATAPLGRSVLLTGVTGFLGPYLLEALAQGGVTRIECLVRARDNDEANVRLKAHLHSQGIDIDALGVRVRAIAGDLGTAHLGINTDLWRSLASELDAVVHNGANVNFVFDYPALREENVVSTRECLALACEGRVKTLHFVSTWAVFGAARYAGRLVAEGEMPAEAPPGGYAQSKYVSEKIVADARTRGVSANIYRPTLIGWDPSTGRYNAREAFSRLVAACVATQTAPEVDFVLPITPVRAVAKAIVGLAAHDAARDGAWHVTTEEPVLFSSLIETIRAAGYPLERAPWRVFHARALRHAEATHFPAFGRIFPSSLSTEGSQYIELTMPTRACRFATDRAFALLGDAVHTEAPTPASVRAFIEAMRVDALL